MIFLLRDYHIPLIYLSLLFHGLGLICPFAYSLFITTHPLLPSAPSRAGFRRVLFLAQFSLFFTPLMSFQSLNSFSLLSHGCADDLQIYGQCPAESVSLLSASVVSCIDALNSWFSSNRLKLNPSTTEFIWLGYLRCLPSTHPSVHLVGCTNWCCVKEPSSNRP